MQESPRHTARQQRAEILAWRRPRPRRRAPPPLVPPLLLWIHGLVRERAVPPAAVHVALGYLVAMEDMRTDPNLSDNLRKTSAQLLRGSVGRAKAHSFLHLVLEDVQSI